MAKKMGQTEANMKRIFSKKTLSLRQLEKMCESSGLELFELVKMAQPQKHDEAHTFTLIQEKELAADPKLFVVLYLLLGGVSEKKILQHYAFSKAELLRCLLKLDKLNFIRLEAEGKYKLLISKNIRWLTPGPLYQLYTERIKGEFLNSTFSQANEKMRFLNASLSAESIKLFSRRVDRLITEFAELAEMDRNEETHDTKHLWFLICYRPWQFSVLKSYKK